MTQFTRKSFSVGGVTKVDPKRDCAIHGHMPRRDGKHGYRCYFCAKSCTVEGKSANNQPTEQTA